MRRGQTSFGSSSGREWKSLVAAAGVALAGCGAHPPGRPAIPIAPDYDAQVVNPDLNAGMLVPGSHVLLVWGSDGAILRSDDGVTWTHADTPADVDLARIAANSSGSVLVAVGGNGTLLRSADCGRSWRSIEHGLTHADLRAIAFQETTGTWVAAGSHGTVLRSTDGANSWTAVESSLDVEFQALYVDPRTHSILLGGDDGLLGVSTDAGASFNLLPISMPDPGTPITAFYRFGNLLLGTSALGRFITSADDGQSWDLLQADTKAFFTAAAFDPRRGAVVMTGHNGDVLRSVDGGRTWSTTGISIDGRRNYLSAVRFDERSGALIVAGEGGTIARSDDGGATWAKASADVPGGMRGLIADIAGGRLVAFGPGGMLVTSTDSGAHWDTIQPPLENPLREIARVPGSDTLIATGNLGGVIRSTDGGLHWHSIEIDFPNVNTPPDLRALIESPRHELIAAGPPGAILRADAGAGTWSVAHWTGIEQERAFTGLLVDHERQLLIAIEARGEMQVSRDAGKTWVPSTVPGSGKEFTWWQGAVLESKGVLLVAGKSGAAARSTDGARTWIVVDTHTRKNLYGSYADAASGLLFLMGQDGTLLRSIDFGVSWTAVPAGISLELRRMFRDPRSGALICYGAHGAIVRSSDDGLTWKSAASGTDGVLRTALTEPGTGNLMLAGGQGTLLRSRDGGITWQRLVTHTTRHFTGMVSGKSGELVLVGERIVRLVPH